MHTCVRNSIADVHQAFIFVNIEFDGMLPSYKFVCRLCHVTKIFGLFLNVYI